MHGRWLESSASWLSIRSTSVGGVGDVGQSMYLMLRGQTWPTSDSK